MNNENNIDEIFNNISNTEVPVSTPQDSIPVQTEQNLVTPTVTHESITPEVPTQEPARSALVEQPAVTETAQPVVDNMQQTSPVTPVLEQTALNNNIVKPKKKKPILLIIIILLVLVGTCFGVKFLFFNDSKGESSISKTATSFFIQNESNKYALFNNKGKKLTDFIFDGASSFYGGGALVTKSENSKTKYGIINTNGKMIVDFDKYENIYSLFYVTHNNIYNAEKNGTTYLLTIKGKVLGKKGEVELIDYNSYGDYAYYILKDTKNKKISVLNEYGDILKSFSFNGEEPSTNEEDGVLSIFYDNTNYYINLDSFKEISTYKNETHYCVDDASKDKKTISLNSCGDDVKDTKYLLLVDGKIKDLSSKCDYIYIDEEIPMCSKDGNKYLLDSNYNLSLEIYKYTDTAYDKNGNAVMEGNKTVDFYNNNEKVNSVECRYLVSKDYVRDNAFILSQFYSATCGTKNDVYEFYNKKGEKIGKEYKKVYNYDSNNLIVVSEDEENYYLLDGKGNKASNIYDSIVIDNDTSYYFVSKNKKYGIVDNKGKEVFEPKYSNVKLFEDNNEVYGITIDENKVNTLYSLKNKKKIIELKGSPSLYDNYFTISEDNVTKYYTYSGKLFYKSK